MDARQWRSLGALLSHILAAKLPTTVADELPTEDYRTPAAAFARVLDERLRKHAAGPAGSHGFPTIALARDWLAAGDSIATILAHGDDLGDELRSRSTTSVVCHGDAHVGNVLLSDDADDESGEVWLLDWDEVVLAPPERDLMFVIEGVLTDAPVTAEQQSWFFEGYGPADIDPIQLAYYRCSSGAAGHS